jgi:hypothetical protein
VAVLGSLGPRAADGRVHVVTDNDGVKDWTGETHLLDLGPLRRVLH